MNWDKVGKQNASRTRGRAKDEFEKTNKSGRPMTFKQRRYLNQLCDEHDLPHPTSLSVYDASLEISRLKGLQPVA